MRIGKLSNEQLQEAVLDKLHVFRDDILVRPGIGMDCAVVNFGQSSLVISSDPITGASRNIGNIAVGINCNDIAAGGGETVGIMLTVLAPPSIQLEELAEIMEDASNSARDAGVEILGGHTEITDAVNRVVISATAVGRIDTSRVKKAEDTEYTGKESLLMTKWAGLEGTGIIAGDFEEELKSVLKPEEITESTSMLGYLSVEKDGKIASENGAIAMHDVTEGGVLGAIWEICTAQGVGCKVDISKIPVKSVTKKICAYFSIDPLKLISSGSLLIVCERDKCGNIIDIMTKNSIDCVKIGELTEDKGVMSYIGDESFEIEPPESDELYKVVSV